MKSSVLHSINQAWRQVTESQWWCFKVRRGKLKVSDSLLEHQGYICIQVSGQQWSKKATGNAQRSFPMGPPGVNPCRTRKISVSAGSLIGNSPGGCPALPRAWRREPTSRELWQWKFQMEGRQGKEIFCWFTDPWGLRDFNPGIPERAVSCMPWCAPYLPSFSELHRQRNPMKMQRRKTSLSPTPVRFCVRR